MKSIRTAVLVAGLLSWGGSGANAWATITEAAILNTGAITGPNLVSTGMANILVYVRTQPGARYAWTITGGTIPGVTSNAAVVFNAGAVGTVTLQCTVTLAGVETVYAQEIPVIAKYTQTLFTYGSGFGADSLANTQVGGPNANVVSYRFQAKHASALNSVRVFFIWSMQKLGYQAGAGGTIRVDVQADDGTAAHVPTGPVLATLTYGNILAQNNYFPLLTFPYPAVLRGGGFYHLVFTNIDPSPTTEYVSLDTLYTDAQTAPMQPGVRDIDFAVLVRSGAGAWKPRNGFTPTLELDFADGGVQGNSYLEVWSTNPKTISGAAGVREAFKVSGPSRFFSKVAVRLQRLAGTSPLTLRVELADGTLIQEGTVAAETILQGVSDWVTLPFPLTSVLSSGVAYNLVLSSPADTQYSAFAIRKGKDKGFSMGTYFPDGYAQFTTTGDAGWLGWDQWGTPNLKTGDLQFMFIP